MVFSVCGNDIELIIGIFVLNCNNKQDVLTGSKDECMCAPLISTNASVKAWVVLDMLGRMSCAFCESRSHIHLGWSSHTVMALVLYRCIVVG